MVVPCHDRFEHQHHLTSMKAPRRPQSDYGTLLSKRYEITQESCATRVAAQARRYPQTVMEWLHLYNTHGPEALVYQCTGGPPHDGVDCRTNVR
jgi:hypothetical protein